MSIERWNHGAIGRSHAVAHAGLVWTVANTRQPGTPLAAQVADTLAFLEASLLAAGSGKHRLLSVQVLLADIADRPAFDALWCAWIGPDPQHWPQRAVYGATLAPGLALELIVTAARA